MKRIESFTVNHLKLKKGLYVSRKDVKGDTIVTTFDLRLTAPNEDEPVPSPALHTIEHLAATFLRNSDKKDEIIYFGPMGCRTGCYLVMFGALTPYDVYDLVVKTCEFIELFEGEIPGNTAIECGNYKEHDLENAKKFIIAYKNSLLEDKNLFYPV